MTNDGTWSPDPTALAGRIAVVAGAHRAVGRAVAAALGELGATVICTGPASTPAPDSRHDRPAPITDTAELVTSLGGVGIPIPVDHHDPIQVALLADRVRAEHGHIDVLVNDIWGNEQPATVDPGERTGDDLTAGLHAIRRAIDTHLVTSHFLLPLLTDRPGGLHVEMTAGMLVRRAADRPTAIFHDLTKLGADRLASSLGGELAPRGVTAVAITPCGTTSCASVPAASAGGWCGPDSDRRRPACHLADSLRSVGRGIAALAVDPHRDRWNQRSVDATLLARAYGIRSVDTARADSRDDPVVGVASALGSGPSTDPTRAAARRPRRRRERRRGRHTLDRPNAGGPAMLRPRAGARTRRRLR